MMREGDAKPTEILGKSLVLEEKVCSPGCILVSDEGRILEATAVPVSDPDAATAEAQTWISPGFVDLQVNGFAGIDLNTAAASECHELGASLVRTGVTSFLPTLISKPVDRLLRQLDVLAESHAGWPDKAARALGIHLEGPFLNPANRGVHDAASLRLPDLALMDEFIAAARGRLRLLTIAPELPGALELIDAVVSQGIVVAIGHSSASYELAKAAIEHGATLCTHFGNAMSQMRQREPGLIAACLDDDRVYLCMIPDLVHLHAGFMRVAARCKSPQELILVSDATAAAAARDRGVIRELRLGDVVLEQSGDACRDADGQLAGSSLTMDEGFSRFRKTCGASLWRASLAAATNPARALGLDAELGSLRPGCRADVLLWSSRLEDTPSLVSVWIDGARVEI